MRCLSCSLGLGRRLELGSGFSLGLAWQLVIIIIINILRGCLLRRACSFIQFVALQLHFSFRLFLLLDYQQSRMRI